MLRRCWAGSDLVFRQVMLEISPNSREHLGRKQFITYYQSALKNADDRAFRAGIEKFRNAAHTMADVAVARRKMVDSDAARRTERLNGRSRGAGLQGFRRVLAGFDRQHCRSLLSAWSKRAAQHTTAQGYRGQMSSSAMRKIQVVLQRGELAHMRLLVLEWGRLARRWHHAAAMQDMGQVVKQYRQEGERLHEQLSQTQAELAAQREQALCEMDSLQASLCDTQASLCDTQAHMQAAAERQQHEWSTEHQACPTFACTRTQNPTMLRVLAFD